MEHRRILELTLETLQKRRMQLDGVQQFQPGRDFQGPQAIS